MMRTLSLLSFEYATEGTHHDHRTARRLVAQRRRAPPRAQSRPSMNGTAIEVAGLAKRIGAVDAVRDASFVAAPGRVTGFLGPNGAGKSTTLRMLLGLTRPDAGSA